MSNINLTSPKFDLDRQLISRQYLNGKTKEEIFSIWKDSWSQDGTSIINDKDMFSLLIDRVIVDIEEKNKYATITSKSILRSDNEINSFQLTDNEYTTWGAFKKKLLDKNIKNIITVEQDVKDIILSLKDDTYQEEPFKGLVIGNVQSGKTNNMEGVISASGDNGINLFIVITGMITKLKDQTFNRFIEDIRELRNLNLTWSFLDSDDINSDKNKISKLSFDDNKRYVLIVLKQIKRLKDLNKWICGGSEINPDLNKMKQMKVLVIDDEADQASIDTRNIDNEKEIQSNRSKINEQIVKLVNNKNFKSMNYLGYTATPYANVLNEYKAESLYPKSFVKLLSTPNNYIGAKQIFGYDDSQEIVEEDQDNNVTPGLDIIRNISLDDIEAIKKIHAGDMNQQVESLNNAIAWFLITAAYTRNKSLMNPVSMLIHTSRKTNEHYYLKEYVDNFFKQNKNIILNLCESLYLNEIKRFNLEMLKASLPKYDVDRIEDYIDFKSLRHELEIILDDKPSFGIPIDSESQYNFCKDGLFICVDNSQMPTQDLSSIYYRLAYPDKNQKLNKAPLFIVIGGNTLSRGLTIEGLTTSYFVRNAIAADTLMQMGRWFGYRYHYELYQRIYMTDKTKDAFKELAAIEEELKFVIQDMNQKHQVPKEYPIKIKNVNLRITAKNKMQSAVECDFDYSGTLWQVFKFDNNKKIIEDNLTILTNFINGLDQKSFYMNSNYVYKGVSFDKIKYFINDFSINKEIRAFANKDILLNWMDQCTNDKLYLDWNIILSSSNNNEKYTNFKDSKINWCIRTAKKGLSNKDVINIGALNNPNHLISDIDEGVVDDVLIQNYKNNYTQENLSKIRSNDKLVKTPLLIIYLIDPKSRDNNRDTRISLSEYNLGDKPIPAFSIYIPGAKDKGKKYAKYFKVPLNVNLNSYDIEDDE